MRRDEKKQTWISLNSNYPLPSGYMWSFYGYSYPFMACKILYQTFITRNLLPEIYTRNVLIEKYYVNTCVYFETLLMSTFPLTYQLVEVRYNSGLQISPFSRSKCFLLKVYALTHNVRTFEKAGFK